MSYIYVPEAFLRAQWIWRRDQIFKAMCEVGHDYGKALEIAREQTDWEFRDWKTHESQLQCESQKDYYELLDGEPYQ